MTGFATDAIALGETRATLLRGDAVAMAIETSLGPGRISDAESSPDGQGTRSEEAAECTGMGIVPLLSQPRRDAQAVPRPLR